ncbi:anti-sigma factor domain-containing protein [Paenibacillus senegalensis]|uniref:anti-sigma factor domain-containing protein n=1 Tax=Paenibacillus senegalensis TaxID=1465766 RepID=UPI000287CAD4|nr:anti-sigma factor domain-containing protein [Paenibacillus senegalensis]
MNRGIVVEIRKKSVVVMTPEGRFIEVRQRESGTCLIGEEIWFATPIRRRFPSVSILSTVAAAIIFVMIGMTMFSYVGSKEVVAYISLDFNPSIELGIDKMEKVRYLTGLNMEGRDLVDGVEYKGKALKDVTMEIVRRIEERFVEDGSNDIIIASTLVAPKTPIDEHALSQEVQKLITEQVMLEFPQYKDHLLVTSFIAPKEVREAAAEEGLSAGKYAVYLNARVNGHFLNIEDMKENSIYAIAQQAGGLDQLINPGDWSKESMRTWLEDEISGTLELKLEQLYYKHSDTELSDEQDLSDIQALHNYAPNKAADNKTELADAGEGVVSSQQDHSKNQSSHEQAEALQEQKRLAMQSEQERQQEELIRRQQELLAEQERQQAEAAKREQERLAEQRELERQQAEAIKREQEKQAEQLEKERERQEREREKQEKERERLEREQQKQLEKERERQEREREKQEKERERLEREQQKQLEKEREQQEREREKEEKERERLEREEEEQREKEREREKNEREREENEREQQQKEQNQEEWLYEKLKQEQERLLEKYKEEEQKLKDHLQEQKGELENLINDQKQGLENQVNEELGRLLDQFKVREEE